MQHDNKARAEGNASWTGYRMFRAVLTVSLLSLCRTGLRYSCKVKQQKYPRTNLKLWHYLKSMAVPKKKVSLQGFYRLFFAKRES